METARAYIKNGYLVIIENDGSESIFRLEYIEAIGITPDDRLTIRFIYRKSELVSGASFGGNARKIYNEIKDYLAPEFS